MIMMKDLTRGNEWKLIIQFTVPMLLANLFQQLYLFVDRIVVGNYLGKSALAAIGNSMSIIFAIISIVVGISMAGTILISQYYGARDEESIRKTVDTVNVFLLLAGIVITIAGYYGADFFMEHMKMEQGVSRQEAVDFMRSYFVGILGLFGYHATSAYLRGVGNSKTPLYIILLSSLVNAVLVYVFVAHLHWGIKGAAWATVIAQTVSFLSAVIYLQVNSSLIRMRFIRLKFDWKILKKFLVIGFPTGIHQTLVALGMLALMRYINQYGDTVAAAYTTGGIIDMICILPAMNFSMALITFTGQNLGAGFIDRVRKGVHVTQVLSVAFTLFFSIIVLIFSHQSIAIFNKNPDVIRIGQNYIWIVAGTYVFFSVMFVYNGVLRGAGDTWIPMIITLVSLWLIRIPLAGYLMINWKENGIFMAIPVSWILGMIASYVYYKKGNWQKSKIIEKPLEA